MNPEAFPPFSQLLQLLPGVAVFISLPVQKWRDGLKVIWIELELEEINGFCRLWFRVLSHKEALEEWSNY